ncbi:hypothetical protein CY35_05G085300 [Sphagnum magellanicum]|nr:hypothetical protein CY35_05G085300 [Sphagnum magellanicum]
MALHHAVLQGSDQKSVGALLLPDLHERGAGIEERECCCCWRRRRQQQSRRTSFILVIRLFAIHSLLSLSSVALETAEGISIQMLHASPNSGSRSSSPPIIPSSSKNHTSSPSPSPSNRRGSPLDASSPSPAVAIDIGPQPNPDPERLNSEEKAGIILAIVAAVLQVAVVTYLLAKRRQMLAMVCDYDPRKRTLENHHHPFHT